MVNSKIELLKARLTHLEEKRQSEFPAGPPIADGEAQCNLDMSNVPTTSELWRVNEQLHKQEDYAQYKNSWRDKYINKNVVKSNVNSLKLKFLPFTERGYIYGDRVDDKI